MTRRCSCDPGDECGYDEAWDDDGSIPLVEPDLSRIADAVGVDPLEDDPHSWPRSAFMGRPGH